MSIPLIVIPLHIPVSQLLKLAVDLEIPIYDDQVNNLLEDFYIKDALSIAPINIPPELLRREVQNPDSNLNKTLALFYTFMQMQEIAKLEKIKIKNEIERLEKIQEAFQQYLFEKGQSELIKQFWDAQGDTEKEKQLQEKMKQQREEEMLHFLQFLQAVTKARGDLTKVVESLNQSTEMLTKILDERVETAINVFEGERAENLVEDAQQTIAIANQLEIERKRLAEMGNILNAARALGGQQDANEVQRIQAAVNRQQNAVANYEAMGKINREYLEEQTNILIGQQAKRTRMPQILRSHNVDPTTIGPGGVTARVMLGTVIQHMRAARDRKAYMTKLDQLQGIVTDNPSVDPESVIKPSDIVKSNVKEKLTRIRLMRTNDEKREVGNIRKYKFQIRNAQKEIHDLERELNKMTGKTPELADDKFRHRMRRTRGE